MMTLISAVTTSVIINVTTILIATTTPVESSSSSDLSSTVVKAMYFTHTIAIVVVSLIHYINTYTLLLHSYVKMFEGQRMSLKRFTWFFIDHQLK